MPTPSGVAVVRGSILFRQMGDLTRNFSRSEFDCHSGEQYPSDRQERLFLLAFSLQRIRDHICEVTCVERPVTVISAYRDLEYNRKIGSNDTSRHVYGNAADIRVEGMTPSEVYEIVEDMIGGGLIPQGGLGLYRKSNFVHYDTRGFEARWEG